MSHDPCHNGLCLSSPLLSSAPFLPPHPFPPRHRDEILCIAVLLSGTDSGVLATGCEDGTINVWGVLGESGPL